MSDSATDHLVMSTCRVVRVLLAEGVSYDQCVLLAKLLAFALLHFVLQGQTCLIFQVFLDFLLFIPDEKDIYFLALVLGGLVGLHRVVQLQLLQP